MKRIDGEKAFGRVDPKFERHVQNTLTLLQSQKENEKMKKKIKFVPLIAAALVILTAGLALAASRNWGLRDFLQKRNTENVLPEAEDMIYEPTDQHQEKGENAAASLTVGEILFDGTTAQFVVYAAPKDEKSLFVLPDSLLDDCLSDLGERFEGETMTIREYADQNGKEAVYRLSFGFTDSSLFVNSMDYQIEKDGSMACHLTASAEQPIPETFTATLTCYMDDLISNQSIKEYVSFTVSWSSDKVLTPVESTEPVTFDGVGLRIDRVTLNGTPLAVRARIEITVLDKEKYKANNYPSFAFIDEDGNRLPMDLGEWGEDSFGPLDQNEIDTEQWYEEWEQRWDIEWGDQDGENIEEAYRDRPIYTRYVQLTTLPAAESLPDEICLAAYDDSSDKLYPEQAQTIQLFQVES